MGARKTQPDRRQASHKQGSQDVRLEALTFRQLETAEGKHGVKHVVQHGHDRTENL